MIVKLIFRYLLFFMADSTWILKLIYKQSKHWLVETKLNCAQSECFIIANEGQRTLYMYIQLHMYVNVSLFLFINYFFNSVEINSIS